MQTGECTVTIDVGRQVNCFTFIQVGFQRTYQRILWLVLCIMYMYVCCV